MNVDVSSAKTYAWMNATSSSIAIMNSTNATDPPAMSQRK